MFKPVFLATVAVTAVAAFQIFPASSYYDPEHPSNYNPPPKQEYKIIYTNQPSGDCRDAIEVAESKYDIPQGMLLAIARTESGHGQDQEPHPWAINNAGQSYYPESFSDAKTIVQRLWQKGETNIDMGCMQINWRWHKTTFTKDLNTYFDAYDNAEYAAKLLLRLKKQHKDWHKAIGHYHNGDPSQGQRRYAYINKVMNNWK